MGARRGAGPTSLILLVLLALLLTGCDGAQNAMDPSGPRAAQIATLILVTTILGTVVWVLVVVLLFAGVLRAPSRTAGPYDGRLLILGGGVVLPAVTVFALWVYGGVTLAEQDAPREEPAFTIDVIGHQWWWEFRYPDHGFVTANEMHIPTGVPVMLRITSSDVVHSFWVPTLAGKIDAMPDHVTTLWVEADSERRMRGQCAEFCGLQHANMAFFVFAQAPEDFEAWAADQAEPGAAASNEVLRRGREIFLGSSCVYCHTVVGTNASGRVGPDLTHLASRESLAAGVVPLTRGSLAGWIIDPQSVKPGALMPGSQMSSDELQALLAYLMSLE